VLFFRLVSSILGGLKSRSLIGNNIVLDMQFSLLLWV